MARTVTPQESQAMRDAWLAEHGERSTAEEAAHVEPIPDPEVRSTPVEPGDPRLFSAARKFLIKAREAGWEARATYSRGPWLHSTQWTTCGISDLVLVRCDLAPLHAVAFWRDGKFEHGWTWREGTPSLEKVNSKELMSWLKQEQ